MKIKNFAITLFCLALCTSSLHAKKTLEVRNSDDSGSGSLRYFVENASSGDTITFSPVVTNPIILTTGEILIDKELIITGKGITISGNRASTLFSIASATVVLDGLTMTGSFGACLINNGSLTVSHCNLTDNVGNVSGAIENYGPLTVTSCRLANNIGSYSGAIYNKSSSLAVTKCVLTNNSGMGSGAIYTVDGLLTVTSCLIANNYGSDVGAINNAEGSGDVTIEFSTIQGNYGGAFLTHSSSDAQRMMSSTISDNVTFLGGAVCSKSGTLTVQDCTLSGNFGGEVGAFTNYGEGTVIVSNSTMVDNTGGNSGAVLNESPVTLINCTLTANSGQISGAIRVYGNSLTLQNCIVAGNVATSHTPDIYGKIISNGYNFIGNPTGTTPAASDLTFANTATTLVDLLQTTDGVPLLANNGGETKTVLLVAGSPAIKAGNVVDASISPWDQRGVGFDRIVDGYVDIGAVEFSEVVNMKNQQKIKKMARKLAKKIIKRGK